MIMDAAVINGAVWTKMSPTPTPTRVIPPMAHELLSSFLVVMMSHLNIEALNLGQTLGKAYDKYHEYQLFKWFLDCYVTGTNWDKMPSN